MINIEINLTEDLQLKLMTTDRQTSVTTILNFTPATDPDQSVVVPTTPVSQHKWLQWVNFIYIELTFEVVVKSHPQHILQVLTFAQDFYFKLWHAIWWYTFLQGILVSSFFFMNICHLLHWLTAAIVASTFTGEWGCENKWPVKATWKAYFHV